MKYARNILQCTDLQDSKSIAASLSTAEHFTSHGSQYSDSTFYRSLVGALQYLTITRTDLSYAINQNDSIANKYRNGDWNWSWSREQLGSRQSQLLDSLVQDIGFVTISDRTDCWSCSVSADGMYTVKSVRDHIDHKILPVSNCKTCWYKFLPRKVNVFLWRFRLDSLSVRWNLSAKEIDINSVVCPVCTNGVETSDHLFFRCSLASDLWRLVRVWLNCNLPPLSSWETFIVWLEGVNLSSVQKKKVIASVVTLLWVLWRFSNGVVFKDAFCNRDNLFHVTRLFTFRWFNHRGKLVSNWNTWLSVPL
ncbi:uncharacterized protein [Rutidosis leptorrhynchoides]|uniref:uncharacterized protein n=1 Tax=Rutidosis leptorrhynchoides TaxID=125765 RepID=UPI003A9A0CC7